MAAHRRYAVASVLAVACLAGCLLAAGCTGSPATGSPAAKAVEPVTHVIVISPDIGEIIAPAPAGAKPRLTAAQALARSTGRKGRRVIAIPANVTPHLGLLTLPIGPSGPGGTEAYTVRNQLVYGFSWHNCPASRNPRVRRLPPNPCVEWNFINANTGHQIDDTWQIWPPGHRRH
jgi:hypothetical protein